MVLDFWQQHWNRLFLILVFAIMWTFLFEHVTCAHEIVLEGSNTFSNRILTYTIPHIKSATGVDVKASPTDTANCIIKLVREKLDVCAASVSLSYILDKGNLSNDNNKYQEYLITKHIVVPIVNKDNPVNALTWEQLSDISRGNITNWKNLSGNDIEIVVVTYKKDEYTRQVFNDIVMNKRSYTRNAKIVESDEEMVAFVSSFKGAIGIVSGHFIQHSPQDTKIIKTNEVSRPLSIITRGAPNQQLQAVINFLRTSEAEKLFH
ncbi:MAG: substrate-binding domain-containing protein [Candidatus Magnetoovum sp. WYHC-5]|nr:substrate-binding domain-containing protein [Candidatus Magnetoovum sp. WYHC-5]